MALLKSQKIKRYVTYKGTKMRIRANFSVGTTHIRVQWNISERSGK